MWANSLATRGPHQGQGKRIMGDLSASVADGGRALLAHQRTLAEPLQAEGGDDVRGLAGGDALRHGLPRHGAGLEPVGAPAHVDEEAVDRRPAMIGEKSGVMSHRPAHCRSSRTLVRAGMSSSTCPARPSMNSSEPRIE